MSTQINRSNYEEFYLDYLEGNLGQDDMRAFEAFLADNPDLMIDEEPTLLLNAESLELDPIEKLYLKSEIDLADLNDATVDYFLIAQQEGQLTAEQSAQLNNWIVANATYRQDAKLMSLAKLTPATDDVYTGKSELKQAAAAGRVIPMPVWWTSAAVAAGLAFFFLWNQSPVVDQPVGTPIATNETKQEKQPDSNTPVITVPNTQTVAASTYKNSGGAVSEKSYKTGTSEELVLHPLTPRVIDTSKPERELVALNIERVPDHQEPPTTLVDLAAVTAPEKEKMANPAKLLTDGLSNMLNRTVDFRSARAAKKKGNDFFLKIGKFEVAHSSSGSVASMK